MGAIISQRVHIQGYYMMVALCMNGWDVMTGSIRNFLYEDSFGNNWGVRKDESSAEALSGSNKLFNDYTAGTQQLPRGIRMRYVNAVLSTDPSIRKRFEIGRQAIFNSVQPGSQIIEAPGGLSMGGTYNVTSKVGEFVRLLTVGDTGQLDGDNP